MNIIQPLDNESYNDYITRILQSRQNIKDPNYYQEKHHILARCLGGTDTKENLIYLYAQEHYYAHKLLALENPNNISLQRGWVNMYTCKKGKRRVVISADEFAELRIKASKNFSGKNNPCYGKNPFANKTEEEILEIKLKISKSNSGPNNSFYGKHHSDETKLKISAANFGKKRSEEFKQHDREMHLGKKLSEETKQKISKSKLGEKNPNYGKISKNRKKIICVTTGKIYDCIQDAIIEIGSQHIIDCCKGRRNSCGKDPITGQKLQWAYYGE